MKKKKRTKINKIRNERAKYLTPQKYKPLEETTYIYAKISSNKEETNDYKKNTF